MDVSTQTTENKEQQDKIINETAPISKKEEAVKEIPEKIKPKLESKKKENLKKEKK